MGLASTRCRYRSEAPRTPALAAPAPAPPSHRPSCGTCGRPAALELSARARGRHTRARRTVGWTTHVCELLRKSCSTSAPALTSSCICNNATRRRGVKSRTSVARVMAGRMHHCTAHTSTLSSALSDDVLFIASDGSPAASQCAWMLSSMAPTSTLVHPSRLTCASQLSRKSCRARVVRSSVDRNQRPGRAARVWVAGTDNPPCSPCLRR